MNENKEIVLEFVQPTGWSSVDTAEEIRKKKEAQQKADAQDHRQLPAFGDHRTHALAHGGHAHLRAQRKEHDAHNDHSRAQQEAEQDAGGDGSNGEAEHQHDGHDGQHRLKRFQ